MSEEDAYTLSFLPDISPDARQLANRYAALLHERGVVDLHDLRVVRETHASARSMVISIALSKLAYLSAHTVHSPGALKLAEKIQSDLIAQMVTFGYWVSPWVELIYQEFPGSVPTFSEIAAYEERAKEGRKAQSIRATELVVWCVGVRDQLEFHDYDFQAADMRAIQLLAVRWMVAGKRSAHDDQRHAWEVIRQSSKPHHPAWTIVLDTHFPID